MPCLNCTSRVLRIFLHDALLPNLRPLRQPQFRRPISFSRLSSHIATTARLQQLRSQSSLAKSELTDDDYVPFVYPAHLAVPAGEEGIPGGSGSRSGWPPPVPEVVDGEGGEVGYGCEPDIELTEPYEAEEWWNEIEAGAEIEDVFASEGGEGEWDHTIRSLEENASELPSGGRFLTRDGSWTLDSSPIVYMFHTGKGGKRPSVAAKKEQKRLENQAAKAAAEELKRTSTEGRAQAKLTKGEQSIEKELKKTGRGKKELMGPKKAQRITTSGQGTLKDGEKKESPGPKKTQKRASQDQKTLEGGEKKRKSRMKDSTEATESIESPEKKNSLLKNEKTFTQTKNGTESSGKKKPYKRVVNIPREGESLEQTRRGSTRPAPDHWNLFPVSAEVEPTRLQKYIASKPRNTVERWMVEKANLQAKFKGANWTPPKKLSPEAQEAIRVLNKNHPEYTTPRLAEQFEVSPEAIRRILKSKWREAEKSPEKEEEWARRWERRGDRVWQRWVDMGVVQTKKMKKEKRRKVDVTFEKERVVEEKKDDSLMMNLANLSSRIL